MKLLRLFVFGTLEKTSFLPSQCISCQREGLEISDLYEQWGDYVYEDNSSPLPANDKITWKSTNTKIMTLQFQKIIETRNRRVYFLNAYHIISHTKPTPLIQHLFGTRSMQQPI